MQSLTIKESLKKNAQMYLDFNHGKVEVSVLTHLLKDWSIWVSVLSQTGHIKVVGYKENRLQYL